MKVWTVFMVLCLLYGFLYCVAGDSNGCYDSSWTYHAHTHSCFKLFKLNLTWGDALRKCQCHDKHWNFCQWSSLATIKDEQTNEFVKEFLTRTYQFAYIGLYKTSDNQHARWLTSDEVLTYNDFRRATGSNGTFYTYIKQDGWYITRSDYRLPFMCQTKADNKPMTIQCPKPVRVSMERTKLSFSCNFNFSRWDAFTWTDSSASEVATCGNDWKCTSPIGQIYSSSISSNDKSSSLTYEGEIHRDLEGPWKCSISDSNRPVDQLLDRRSCDLKVYEPAEDISCDTDVTSNGVMVTCTVEKIYPDAICFWKYKNIDEHSYTTAEPSEIISPVSHEYPDMNTKYKYFTTQCQLNLTRETMTFSVGALIVKVRIAPNVGPVSVPREDRRYQEATVNIEAPGKPVFKFTNDSVIDSDVVSYLAGEQVDIVCEISDGFPMVYQTTMACTFIGMANVSRGNRYILDMQATREMNGKTCRCWGHHITAPTTTATIKFKILAASQVTSFISNPIEPKEGEKVTLSCQGHGVPEPEISISPNENAQITDKTSKNSLRVTFTAECQKRGPYKCTSENVINGQVYTDVKYLNLTVLCPPTTCGGDDHVPTFVTRLGKAHITLCAVGFPIPDKDKLSLHKDVAQDSDLKDVPGSFYGLKLITEGDILKGVDITFYDLKATDMVAYRLYSPKTKKVAYSYLKFKLTSKVGANITSMFINMKIVDYQNQKIEVDSGTNLSIKCIGIGNPQPTVIIRDNRGGKLPVQLDLNDSTWAASSHIMASCQDVGKYTCMANNTVAHSIRDFWLLVKCPLQLDDEDVDERRFDFTEGENATIHIKVKGHPGPNENELVKIPTSGKLKGIDSEEQIDTSLYEFVSYQVDEASWELRLFLYQVKVNDSARYRLHVGNGVGEDFKYTFEMTVSKDPRPKSPVSSSYLSTGTIVGLILSSNVVVIILTILSMIAFRKLRERNKYKTKKTSGDGHVTVEFHRPEQEDIGSGNDNVPADASFSGKDAPPLYKNMASKDDFEGEELQSIDTTMYEAMQHAENLDDEREGNENYDIVHADDPSYINLNREPSRQYMTIDDQDPYHVYETPTPAK